MASKVPLNKFRSLFAQNITTLSAVYTGKIERATIVVQAQATNPTNNDVTVSFKVSSNNAIFPIAENILIPPYDSISLVAGRLVIQGIDGTSIFEPDVLMFQASSPLVSLSLGLLETKNTD